jgi:lysozyme
MRSLIWAMLVLATILFSTGCTQISDDDSTQSVQHSESDTSDPLPKENRQTYSLKGYEDLIAPALEFAEQNNIDEENLILLADLIKQHDSKLFGIDVSHHQETISWDVAALVGVHFAYIKASEGVDWQDPKFVENWQQSKAAGIRRGAYHMFRPEDDYQDQVDNFLKALEVAGLDETMLPPVLDVEQVHTIDSVSRDVLHERIIGWLKGVEEALGVSPVVYTNPKFWQGYLSGDHALTTYQLWISEYDTEATEPKTTGAWATYDLWQFSRYGIVPGINKPVDLSRANNAFSELLRGETAE